MRIILKSYVQGDERTTRKFLWYPKTLVSGGLEDTRWLEWANVVQRYDMGYGYQYRWKDKRYEDHGEK